MGDGNEFWGQEPQQDDPSQSEHEERSFRAAHSIAADVASLGLAEVNSFLKQHGLEVRRV